MKRRGDKVKVYLVRVFEEERKKKKANKQIW